MVMNASFVGGAGAGKSGPRGLQVCRRLSRSLRNSPSSVHRLRCFWVGCSFRRPSAGAGAADIRGQTPGFVSRPDLCHIGLQCSVVLEQSIDHDRARSGGRTNSITGGNGVSGATLAMALGSPMETPRYRREAWERNTGLRSQNAASGRGQLV